MGVAPVVGLVERVSEVVEAVAEEWYERGVVEVLVAWVAYLPLLCVLDCLEEFGQAGFDVVLGGYGFLVLGVFKRTVSWMLSSVGDVGNSTHWAPRIGWLNAFEAISLLRFRVAEAEVDHSTDDFRHLADCLNPPFPGIPARC